MKQTEPEVALVLSPEAWVERFHRHCTDHGGARVRQVVMDPALALEDQYATLVVSLRWPALSPAFVDALHRRGRTVVGVYDPTEPGARDQLAGLGVDAVVAADAEMPVFVQAVAALAPAACLGDEDPRLIEGEGDRAGGRRVAVGGPGGTGASEIALGLVDALARARRRSVLVDGDDVSPSIAPRLGLPIEPNLRSAIDAVEYGLGDLERTVLPVPRGSFGIVAGLPNVAAWSQVRPAEVVGVVAALASRVDELVVNIGAQLEDVGGGTGRYGITRALLGEADVVVATCLPTPVGVSRLLAWLAAMRPLAPAAAVVIAVNRAPRDAFRRAELAGEIARTFDSARLVFVPDDRRVDAATWAGALVGRGPFPRAMRDLARDLPVRQAGHGVGAGPS